MEDRTLNSVPILGALAVLLLASSCVRGCDNNSTYIVQAGETKACLVYRFFNQSESLFNSLNPRVNAVRADQVVCLPPQLEDSANFTDYGSQDCYDGDCYGSASAPGPGTFAAEFSQGLSLEPRFSVEYFNKYSRFTSLGFTYKNNVSSWSYPTELDWRERGKVQNVKNQGLCASCWAFSATGVLESTYAIINNVAGTSVSLSEQQLIDCNGGCGSGWIVDGFEYVGRKGGLATQTEYPDDSRTLLEGQNSACKATRKSLQFFDPRFGIKMYEKVNFQGVLGLVLALQQQPVIVSLNGGWHTFQAYTNGTYDDQDCSPYSIDHSVVVVGYNFAPSTPYWILRNSWGEDWGMGGYMNMAITGGLGVCGIHSLPGVYPVMTDPNPCGRINPCGGGRCIPTTSGKNKCICPKTFVSVQNLDGSESCTPAAVCTSFITNPCGMGTCVDDNRGSYACNCTSGFKQGAYTDGTSTCVPESLELANKVEKYAVKEGDTCSGIEDKYGLTEDEFLAQNPDLDCSALEVGTKVIVAKPSDSLGCVTSYSVNNGDSCESIAKMFSLKPSKFDEVNPDVDCSNLNPGQQVCIEMGRSSGIPICTAYQLIYPGDTCKSIMNAHHMKPMQFFKINPGIYCDNFKTFRSTQLPGVQVCIDSIPFSKCKCKRPYTVRAHDTCTKLINNYFNGNIQVFKKWNCKMGCAGRSLKVNQRICLVPK